MNEIVNKLHFYMKIGNAPMCMFEYPAECLFLLDVFSCSQVCGGIRGPADDIYEPQGRKEDSIAFDCNSAVWTLFETKQEQSNLHSRNKEFKTVAYFQLRMLHFLLFWGITCFH